MPVRVRRFVREIAKNKILYLMFLPVAVYIFIFRYIPMPGIVVAFKNYNYRGGIFGSPWIGFQNFGFFFASGKAWMVTRNTILYNVAFLASYTFFSVLTAVLISEISARWFKKISQTLLFLPYFISWVTVSALVYNIFSYPGGFVNVLLHGLGLHPIDIYSTPQDWYLLLPVFYVWKWVGFGSVLYLAAISGIDPQTYEAATIDGASAFQRIRRIVLPQLRPTMVILILLSVGQILRGDFDMFYQLIGNDGVLLNATDIIDTLVFRSLIINQDFGMSSAAGLYQSVLSFVVVIVINGFARRYERDSALF
ncbi:MAG TPA: ABC transporter permease subunit [Spirochaetia bacterium]|nr:ABC transporter permease subunit [Spirochaetia bacterium]